MLRRFFVFILAISLIPGLFGCVSMNDVDMPVGSLYNDVLSQTDIENNTDAVTHATTVEPEPTTTAPTPTPTPVPMGMSEYALPSPKTDGGISVEKALATRRSRRSYQNKAISKEQLSQILWAAYGMTAPGRRTSPSAGALYSLEIYVAAGNVEGIAPGVYKYISEEHKIVRVVEGDVRGNFGDGMLTVAPAILLIGADFDKATKSYGVDDLKYVYMEAGHCAQNVYLQAESLGLGTCSVAGLMEGYVRESFKLPANEKPLYLVPVGYVNKDVESVYIPESSSLSKPKTDGGISVEKALQTRRSQREYQDKAISAEQLSQILWAAYGMTTPNRKTSPSAGALYSLELYVAVGNVKGIVPGVYKYISEEHKIVRTVEGDVRSDFGDGMLTKAPAVLFYSADFDKALESYGEEDLKYVYMEAGHSAQNVYLQAESLGLGTCSVGGFIAGYVRETFRIPTNEEPIYLMPIGYVNKPQESVNTDKPVVQTKDTGDQEQSPVGDNTFAAFIKGYPDKTLRGGSSITREEYVVVLCRISNQGNNPPMPPTVSSFNDVGFSRWSFDAIEWAVSEGILDSGGDFLPAKPITRAEAAEMLAKARGLTVMAKNIFSDIDNHPVKDYILKGVEAGVFIGYPDGTFKPDEVITRNEMITALVRYLLGGEPTDEMWKDLIVVFSDVTRSHWAYKYLALAVHGYGMII